MYKANVDGAVFLDLKVVGIGTVIKDEKGSVVAALSRCQSSRLYSLSSSSQYLINSIHIIFSSS